MDTGKNRVSPGRIIGASALSVFFALISVFATVFQFCVPMTMLMTSAVAIVFINNFAGRRASTIAAVIHVMAAGLLINPFAALIIALASVLPTVSVIAAAQRRVRFSVLLRHALISYGVGFIASIAIAAAVYNGNIVENILSPLSGMMRSLPEEYISMMTAMINSYAGTAFTSAEMLELYDGALSNMIAVIQQQLPGHLFSGAILTGVISTAWLTRSMKKRGLGGNGSYLPIAKWALPSSTTLGLLMILFISFIIYYSGMNAGYTVFITVLCICKTAFSIQALASMLRHIPNRKARTAVFIIFVTTAILGVSTLYMVYGIISAIFGSNGVLKRHMDNRQE